MNADEKFAKVRELAPVIVKSVFSDQEDLEPDIAIVALISVAAAVVEERDPGNFLSEVFVKISREIYDKWKGQDEK